MAQNPLEDYSVQVVIYYCWLTGVLETKRFNSCVTDLVSKMCYLVNTPLYLQSSSKLWRMQATISITEFQIFANQKGKKKVCSNDTNKKDIKRGVPRMSKVKCCKTPMQQYRNNKLKFCTLLGILRSRNIELSFSD